MKCVVVLLLSIGHSLTENQVHRLTDSVVHRRTDSVEYSLTNSLEDSPFCHVMETSGNTRFQSVPEVTPPVGVAKLMDSGQPFVVRGEAREWPAARLWSHAYFQQLFRDQSLFSSTFSTSLSPQFGTDYPNKAVYYGIFLNNQTLASEVAKDYEYPDFIPAPLRLQGNEWIHWGYPPCGAKRHVDLTCTSRVSVQLTGSKRWRLYPPPLSPLATAAPWSQQPLEVLLESGDVLVWFPGWEHETGIETGPSISLSLHFSTNYSSTFILSVSDYLSHKIGRHCNWNKHKMLK